MDTDRHVDLYMYTDRHTVRTIVGNSKKQAYRLKYRQQNRHKDRNRERHTINR